MQFFIEILRSSTATIPIITTAKISKYNQSNPCNRKISSVRGENNGNPPVEPGLICPTNQVSKAICDIMAENEMAAKR